MLSPALSKTPEEYRDGDQTHALIVGVGASSGGLEAFTQLLKPLPANCGMAFVLIQHLDRRYPSALAGILGSATALKVEEATHNVVIRPNHVYAIPPNSDIAVVKGRLVLEQREGKSSTHFPVDRFFRSLALDQGPQAVGIILSGAGSDGTQGLLAIKEACGITFAQDETSAEFGAMPHSAIAAGAVDFILRPADMAAELLKLESQSRDNRTGGPRSNPCLLAEDNGNLQKIFSLLQRATRIDFTHYKRKTVSRRIARRMVVQKCKTVADYAKYLEGNSAEISKLFREILINVTSFFREPASFDQLMKFWRESVGDRPMGQPVRAWVVACASGEEVYSVAICLMELLAAHDDRPTLQIFGTDINEAALEIARTGIYPDSIVNDINPERLSRFFSRTDRGYQVVKSLRECCVFARHDLTKDPPFSRLDLVTCRNVLIYMGTQLQKRVFPMFHYSLRPGGFLMLGSAEALSGNTDLFETVDKQSKLFRRLEGPVRFAPDFDLHKPSEGLSPPTRVSESEDLETIALRTIGDRFAADGFIVNREMRIVLFRGRTSFYLDPAPGTPSQHLLRMIREDLAFKLEGLVVRAIRQNAAVKESGITLERDGYARKISVEIIPLPQTSSSESFYLISFEASQQELPSAPPNARRESANDDRIKEFEREIAEARAHLRNMAEEHEVHIEELRAANEEIRSTNEELQSTNEELGTAKEELQSTNEELSTVNEELSTKNASLAALSDDLKNLFNAASLPILMVDNNLRLRRFTPAAESLLHIVSSDIGRNVTDFRLAIDVPNFKELLEKTVRELTISSLTLQAANERWCTVTIRPYRTVENRIDGAVITYTDIDNLKRSLGKAEDAREYAESILDTLWEPLLVLDAQMRVQRATAGFYRTFQVSKEEIEGRLFFELGTGQWEIKRLRTLLEEILPKNTSFEDFEIEHSFPKIGFRSMRLNARRIRRQGDGSPAILIAIDDVTDRREAAEIRYRRLFEAAKDGILELDGDSGDILDVNPYFLRMCSCTRADLIGKKLWEIGVFDNGFRLRDLVAETRRKETVRIDDIAVRSRDGERFETEMVVNRYFVADEAVIQCNIRDVTERKRAEDELRRSNEDLQQFAYAASHDLQEPLRMVGAYSQLLRKKFLPVVDEDGTRYLDVITSSVNRMEQLIKDLLVYSQTTVHESRPMPVNAEKVLGLTIMNLQLAISDTGAIITNDYLPMVKMDQIQFVQVFQNLISNAIKYRQLDHPPRIHISAELKASEWIFSVKDNGLGFDEKYVDQIFGVFKRLHGREYPGTGIGLSICKKIIEREGGRIWAHSTVGEGSTFFFSIPDRISER